MRGSIPALSFLCFSVIGEFTGSVQEKGAGWNAGLVAVCLVISGWGAFCNSYHETVSYGFGRENRWDPFDSFSRLLDSGYDMPYQYVCYETDGMIQYILKD